MKQTGLFPLSTDVEQHIKTVACKHPELITLSRAGRSVQGLPISAVTVSDRTVSDTNKQYVLIVGGHHGNEESGRLVALALIDWLTTKAASTTLRNQKIVLIPNLNPDSADTDEHGNVNDIWPDNDHAHSGPVSPEALALETVAHKLQPDLFIDLHACGNTGCGMDMVLYPPAKEWTQDDYFLHRMADDAVQAGEKAGIPQMTFPLSWWRVKDIWNSPNATAWAYRQFKSMVFLTENSESNTHCYSTRDRRRAGLAKLKALLNWGNRHDPKLYYPGYPGMMVAGLFGRGAVAIGKTAAARRRSRVGIWQNILQFKDLHYVNPQAAREKILQVEYAGEELKHGIGFHTFARGQLTVASVRLNGRLLKQSETNGYYSWRTGPTTFTVVALHLQTG